MLSATSLPARIGYAVPSFPIGALAGYFLTLKWLIRYGSVFYNPHPSMQGFGYFMMSLAAAMTLAITGFLLALTLPWKRPLKAQGKIARMIVSLVAVALSFLILVAQGHALIFVLALTTWLAFVFYFTYVRHGVLDAKRLR